MFACTDLTNVRVGACIFFGAGAMVVVCITVTMLKGHVRDVAFWILIHDAIPRPVLPDKALHFFVAKDM